MALTSLNGRINHQRGFTLIELMVTVTVLAIVISLSVPGFNTMIANNRSSSLASELTAAINFTRSEAVKRVKRVSICPSSDGTSCLTSSDWAKGWLVFVDKATSDSAALEVGTVLRYWDKLDSKAVASLKKGSASAAAYIRFNPQGLLARASATDADTRTFEVYVTGCEGEAGRKITIGLAGLVNTSRISCP